MSPVYLRVRELRESRGLTQAALAAAARVRIATVSEIENARTTRVDLEVLDRLADALGVEPGELVARTGPAAE